MCSWVNGRKKWRAWGVVDVTAFYYQGLTSLAFSTHTRRHTQVHLLPASNTNLKLRAHVHTHLVENARFVHAAQLTTYTHTFPLIFHCRKYTCADFGLNFKKLLVKLRFYLMVLVSKKCFFRFVTLSECSGARFSFCSLWFSSPDWLEGTEPLFVSRPSLLSPALHICPNFHPD